jgi:hypothetical protein
VEGKGGAAEAGHVRSSGLWAQGKWCMTGRSQSNLSFQEMVMLVMSFKRLSVICSGCENGKLLEQVFIGWRFVLNSLEVKHKICLKLVQESKWGKR